MTNILTTMLTLMLVQWSLRLPVRQILPPLDHTESHTVGNAVSAILGDKGKKKKIKTCSFFLELRSAEASLVK